MEQTISGHSTGCAIASLAGTLEQALDHYQAIPPSIETKVQNMVATLRRTRQSPEALAWAEGVAATLFTMSRAKVSGRANLYASQALRLRRMLDPNASGQGAASGSS